MRLHYLVFLPFIIFNCNAQVTEHFTGTDSLRLSGWHGNTSAFTKTGERLQSSNTVSNTKFYISTPSDILKNTSWSIKADLLFNTSGVNYTDIFLAADDSNLTHSSLSGYFIRLGGTKDEICLYKKTGGEDVIMIDGEDGILSNSSNAISLQVICSKTNHWQLSYTANSGESYISQEFPDTVTTSFPWAGILVSQSTTSFFGKHLFDDFIITEIFEDTVAPKLISAAFTGNNSIALKFDEPLDTSWIHQHDGLQLLSGNTAYSVSRIIPNKEGNEYTVLLSENLIDGDYILKLIPVADLKGNELVSAEKSIKYTKPYQATYKDIVITELMFIPSPSAGLPESEYVEIFNKSTHDIDLSGWILSDPSSSSVLPAYQLPAGTYLVLVKLSDAADFQNHGPFLGLKSLPSLNNSGDLITLTDPENKVIDKVAYKSSWHQDAAKRDGGYALELIDPYNDCLEGTNWTTTVSINGGTPGKENSVFNKLTDTQAPAILEFSSGIQNLTIIFNERMDSTSFNLENFSVTNNTIASVSFHPDTLTKVQLTFEHPIIHSTPHQLTCTNAKDCSGNTTDLNFTFTKGNPPQEGQLLINEILFNPHPYGSDFVELYNNSDVSVELKGLKLANIKNDSIGTVYTVFTSSFVIDPFGYVVVTPDKHNITNWYPGSGNGIISQCNSLPVYSDEEGSVIVMSEDLKVLDRVDYSESMHSPFVSNKEGVSIEKINPGLPSQDKSSWTSAAKEAGYATPGYKNSQTLQITALEDWFEISPLVITPNQDGDNDFMIIRLKSEAHGTLRNVKIFDITGREIKNLERNNTSAANSMLQWDGSDDSLSPVALGHYIIWVEITDKQGDVKHYRKKVVVGDRF